MNTSATYPVYNSFGASASYRSSNSYASSKSGAPSRYPVGYIRPGDHIYICVMSQGKRVLEFSVNNVDSYTALMGEIRYAGRELDGLMRVFIRNHTRGWSEERPLKFYADLPRPRRRSRSIGTFGAVQRPVATAKRMLAPWETH